jgi:putative hydrolase of the HAD superfamily
LSRVLHSTPSDSFISEFADLYVSEWNKGVQYPRGIRELLGRLARQFDLAVITNTHDPALVPSHLARMGVSSLFRTVVTSVEYGIRKPNPAIFKHTLEVLGTVAEDCVYVGDSLELDYEGARSAGIRPLLIDPLRETVVPASARLDSIFALETVLLSAADEPLNARLRQSDEH